MYLVAGNKASKQGNYAEAERQLVAEAGEPEPAARVADQHRAIFQHRNVNLVQSGADAGDVEPPVVVAEDRPDAEPRLEAGERGGPHRVRNALGDEPMGGEIVAQHDDQVGLEPLRGVDHFAHARQSHVRSAGMDVGDRGDGEALAFAPAGR